MSKRWATMWNLNEAQCQEPTPNESCDVTPLLAAFEQLAIADETPAPTRLERLPIADETPAPTRLERLPIEVLEMILSRLRPADLVATAESSPRLEMVVSSPRLWRTSTLQLSSDNTRHFLRQLELAPEVQELKIGDKDVHSAAAAANYDGPAPRVRTLNLSLTELSSELGVALLEKYGPKARHIKLDLCHGPLEPPRCNLALFEHLLTLSSVESLSVRTDSVKDILLLQHMQEGPEVVDIDIQHLKVGCTLQGGHSHIVGIEAAKLVFLHSSSLHTLRLPSNYDTNLSKAMETCTNLKTLACNVWNLSRIQNLSDLHTLFIYAPDSNLSVEDVQALVTCARNSRKVFVELKQLHFVRTDANGNVMPRPASPEFAQAVVCLLLVLCKSLMVLEVEWDVGHIPAAEHSWFSGVLIDNVPTLREIKLHGNQLDPFYYVTLANYGCNLEILDVRRNQTTQEPEGDVQRALANAVHPRATTILTLLRKALPKLTIISDESEKERRDWNSYPSLHEQTEAESDRREIDGDRRVCGDERHNDLAESEELHEEVARKLFAHTRSLQQLAGGRTIVNDDTWMFATLDSAVWSTDEFILLLRRAPALGLLDCSHRNSLSPGRKGHQWLNALVDGSPHIEALRIRAALVSTHQWHLMVPTLHRLKESLRRLELDFRGRTYRNRRILLEAVRELNNLEEFVLRGTFYDSEPVLDWLCGHVRSLTRIDLKDCLMSDRKQNQDFVESLRRLLSERRGTLQAVALPPLPRELAPSVLQTLSGLTDLREVALHANELEYLLQFTSLTGLELYGDRSANSSISADKVASNLRNMSATFRGVQRLTLPRELIRSHLIQEAILDVMPNLKKIEVTNHNKQSKVCAEGPQCRMAIKDLC